MSKKTYQKQEEEEVETKPRHFLDILDEIHAFENQKPRDGRKQKEIENWKNEMNKLIDECNTAKGEKWLLKIK